ncbi:MAG: TonB-dependent receptor [Gammaproteobacteria bacterium]|nr:TonB-dependent receptor [Gammaproteobacteria bacterium]
MDRSFARRARRMARISCLAVAGFLAPVGAFATDVARDFHITAQPLDEALKTFAEQADVQIMYAPGQVQGFNSPALQGRYPIERAIDRMLRGTGLEHDSDGADVIVIRPATMVSDGHAPPSAPMIRTGATHGVGQTAGHIVAMQAAATAAPTGRSGGSIEEVVVTAQKREQSLQEVPMAISAFTAETIREQGFSDLLDVQGHTPGLQISNFSTGQPEISVRGISTKEDGAGANDSTVVSVDDVYIAARTAQIFDIFDLERIEVLRGPQGTLYGRNSIGGSINLVTMKPSDDFKIRLEQTVARYDRYDTRGLINGAITDNLFGKLSFSRRIADGYTKSLMPGVADAHDADSIYWRAQFLWEASERTEALVTFDGGHDDVGPTNREPVSGTGRSGNGNNLDPIAVNVAFGGAGDPFNSLAESEGYMNRDVYGVSAKITHELDPVTLTSITAVRRSEFDWLEDSEGLPPAASGAPGGPASDGFFLDVNDIAQENATQFTQELRLSSRAFDRMDWVTGVFATLERINRTETFFFPAIAGGSLMNSIQKNETIAWAIYGQATYDVTDRIRFTAGGRYSYETKDFKAAGQLESGVPALIQNFTQVGAEDTWTNFSSRFALDFDLTEDVLLYASIAEGFKSGGFTGSPSTAARATTPFDPEQATNYEVGFKSRLFDQHLQANATAFWTDYEDLQVTEFFLPVGGLFGEFITQNAGTAETKGVELELLAVPFEGLEIGATAAYLDARFTDFSPTVPRDDGSGGPLIPAFAGNHLRQAPEWSASIWGRYAWRFTSGAQMVLRVDGRYQDDIFFDPDNNKAAFTPGYDVWDSRLAYTTPGGLIEVAVWARNMFDQEYRTHVFTQRGGEIAFALFGAPRTYGLTVTLNYD